MDVEEAIARLADDPARTGIFTDFDGTLSEIVDVPSSAQAVDGAAQTLTELAQRFACVAVVSGRSLVDLKARLEAPDVLLAGAYGRERSDRSTRRESGWEPASAAATTLVDDLPGVVLEQKGAGIALHYRAAPDLGPEVLRRAEDLATQFGLEALPGRLVVELVRPGPGKADAVAAIAVEYNLATLLVAGDDVADREAFVWAKNSPYESVIVAVLSEEAPEGLADTADIVVGGPIELVSFLRRLR